MANIILITHGEKRRNLPNPGLTKKGERQVRKLKKILQKLSLPAKIYCGVGARHNQTARLLGLTPTMQTPLLGPTVSRSRENKNVFLADGTVIPAENYESISEAGTQYVRELVVDAIVITSRPVIRRLSGNDIKPSLATIYCYDTVTGKFEEYNNDG